MTWVKEGDANSKFFLSMMSIRQRQSSIHLVHVDGVPVEGIPNIRTVVFNHFSSHYCASEAVRPGVEGLNFRKLSNAQAGNLVRLFSLEEVKHAV